MTEEVLLKALSHVISKTFKFPNENGSRTPKIYRNSLKITHNLSMQIGLLSHKS